MATFVKQLTVVNGLIQATGSSHDMIDLTADVKNGGTVGQVLTSQGSTNPPIWSSNTGVVQTVNGLMGSVSLAAGSGVTITASGQTLTFSAGGGGTSATIHTSSPITGGPFSTSGTIGISNFTGGASLASGAVPSPSASHSTPFLLADSGSWAAITGTAVSYSSGTYTFSQGVGTLTSIVPTAPITSSTVGTTINLGFNGVSNVVGGSNLTTTGTATSVTISAPNSVTNVSGIGQIVQTGTANSVTLSYSGVTNVIAGSNLTTTGTASSVTLSAPNSVTNVIGIGQIVQTGTANSVTFSYSGVTNVVGGSNLTTTGTASSVTLSAPNSVTNIVGAGQIVQTGTANSVTLSHIAVTNVVVGSNLTQSGSGTSVTISAPTSVTNVVGGINLVQSGSGNSVTLSAPNSVTNVIAGSNLTQTGTANSITLALNNYNNITVANPTATIGLNVINGSATTAMRSDAAPSLSVTISPTWTGIHTFAGGAIFSASNGTNAIGSTPGTNGGSWTFSAAKGGDADNTIGGLSGAPGGITFITGNGANSSTLNTGTSAGTLLFQGGTGSTANTAFGGFGGGGGQFFGGQGGDGSALQSAGNGGNFQFAGGNAGANNGGGGANGGGISIDSGAGTGAGHAGNITIGTAVANTMQFGHGTTMGITASGSWGFAQVISATLANGKPTSLLGVSGSATANNLGIQATLDGSIPMRQSGTIGWIQDVPGFRNVLINPLGLVNQYAGTSTQTPGKYFVDRWVGSGVFSSGTITWAQNTNDPGPAIPGYGHVLTNMEVYVSTVHSGTLATGDYLDIYQPIEGYNWAQIYGQPFNVSFWALSNMTGPFSVAIGSGGGDWSVVNSYTISATGSWNYISIPFPAASTGTFNYTNGLGAYLYFAVQAGATYTTSTTNTWQSGIKIATSANNTSFFSSTLNYLKICGVQMENGSAATCFEKRNFAQELALCQRYYEASYDYGVAPGTNTGNGAIYWQQSVAIAGSVAGHMMPPNTSFLVPKRIAPTITFYDYNNGAAGSLYNASSGGHRTGCTGSVIGQRCFSDIAVDATSPTGILAGAEMIGHWTASAEF